MMSDTTNVKSPKEKYGCREINSYEFAIST